MRRSTRIDGSAGGEPLSCGNQSTYNRVANAGNLHRLSPFQMPFGILHNLTGKSSLTFSIEKCHFITATGIITWRKVMAKLTKYEKETIILFNEGEDTASIYTYNASLRKRLALFSKKHPDLCRLEKSHEQGGVTYLLDKSRLSIRLQPPYSEERRRKASENAKQNGFNSQME